MMMMMIISCVCFVWRTHSWDDDETKPKVEWFPWEITPHWHGLWRHLVPTITQLAVYHRTNFRRPFEGTNLSSSSHHQWHQRHQRIPRVLRSGSATGRPQNARCREQQAKGEAPELLTVRISSWAPPSWDRNWQIAKWPNAAAVYRESTSTPIGLSAIGTTTNEKLNTDTLINCPCSKTQNQGSQTETTSVVDLLRFESLLRQERPCCNVIVRLLWWGWGWWCGQRHTYYTGVAGMNGW